MVVRQYMYPAILKPPATLSFSDQFAYRPTGSTTAAIITILHRVTHLLATNRYVIVIALDFSKAFDTVRHHALLNKIAELDIPDYNFLSYWLSDFFTELRNITDWATIDKLSLNLSKSEQNVFIAKRRKSHFQTPETLNGL